MSNKNDSISRTLLVALLLCLVCSIIVAGAAVSLRPIQKENKLQDMRSNILAAAGMLEKDKSVNEQFEQIQTRIVNLREGRYATEAELQEIRDAGLNPEQFDQKKSASTPELSKSLKGGVDPAKINRLEKYAAVYVVKESGSENIKKLVLPIHGYGLWSTLYGFIALSGDLDTVEGLGFYSHAETPGLGGEVDNPKWKAQWNGKKLHDESGKLAIEVIKGSAEKGDQYKVDGLSGATLTTRGVNRLVRFWMSKDQFGHFLANIRKQRG